MSRQFILSDLALLLCLSFAATAAARLSPSKGHPQTGATTDAATFASSTASTIERNAAQQRLLQIQPPPKPYPGLCFALEPPIDDAPSHEQVNCTSTFMANCHTPFCYEYEYQAYNTGSTTYESFTYFPTNVTSCAYELMFC